MERAARHLHILHARQHHGMAGGLAHIQITEADIARFDDDNRGSGTIPRRGVRIPASAADCHIGQGITLRRVIGGLLLFLAGCASLKHTAVVTAIIQLCFVTENKTDVRRDIQHMRYVILTVRQTDSDRLLLIGIFLRKIKRRLYRGAVVLSVCAVRPEGSGIDLRRVAICDTEKDRRTDRRISVTVRHRTPEPQRMARTDIRPKGKRRLGGARHSLKYCPAISDISDISVHRFVPGSQICHW